MTEFGYWLSSEEHPPLDLVRDARRAEELGFSFAIISDHFHPWIDAQGESPFVWSVIGGIAAVTERISIATGVTCPLIRTHPAIVAQAAATTSLLFDGRFFLGLGTGLGERDVPILLVLQRVEVLHLLGADVDLHVGVHRRVVKDPAADDVTLVPVDREPGWHRYHAELRVHA